MKCQALAFYVGDRVHWTDPDEGISSGDYIINGIFGDIFELTNDAGSEVECLEHELSHLTKTFAIYYHHGCGSDQWIIKSSVFPTEEQIVELLSLDFEPERDEFIAIEEIVTIHVLELS